MQTVYIGSTLVNDIMLGSQRMDDVFTPKTSLDVQYLVVAGGGAGGVGDGDVAAGGGAGGFLSGSFVLPQNFSISLIVGRGGRVANENGKNSSISSSGLFFYESLGGGFGGTNLITGGTGGSGGGSSNNRAIGSGSLGQGFNGASSNDTNSAGGGGGALNSGSRGVGTVGGNGGSGSLWINGTRYAGGGGGRGQTAFGLGGPGGGGTAGSNATDNTGGGGGGDVNVKTGGTGIVILAYLGSGSRASGGTISYDGTYTYHTFTSASLAGSNGTGSFTY